MPELPDLLYITGCLTPALRGLRITEALVTQPVVLRSLARTDPDTALRGRTMEGISVRGPFLLFSLSGETRLVINLMLSGRVQHQKPGEKTERSLCFSLVLSDGSRLNLCDERAMAKVYLASSSHLERIPAYRELGVDVLSPEFSEEVLLRLARRHPGMQVRSFIHTASLLSAIGNAYADEILFEAKLHPKTFIRSCSDADLQRLHRAIRTVLAWGCNEVLKAAKPVHVKVRDHMRVRNRRGQPCPRCGTTIRREGVLGHDVYFCPACQPATRTPFVDWRTIPRHDGTES